ncbi:importin-4 isoform X3 [Rhea pennata]|uniref:importin-4 isoform X3 n=1 Tax=Rhea pennata TaxID=8795 RepID=UPI002E263B7E
MLGGAHTELLRSLLPDVLAALEKLLGADEELATEALEVLDEFLEADPAAVTPHLRPLLDLCLQVGGDAGRGDAVRARALATVAFVAQRCPKALLRGGLLPPLLGGLLGPLCAAPPPGRPDPEDEEDEEGGEAEGCGGSSPRHAAAQALDALAQALPPEKLLPPLLPLLEPLLGSPQPPARKGGLLALGALAEGCGELLHRRYLEPVLRVLRGGLGDPQGPVRGAAACALRRLADCLQPEVATLAGEMLPTALAALEGPGVREAPAKAWYILESLLECLEVLGALGPGAGPRLIPALELGLELALEEDEPEGRRVLYGLAAAAAAALGADLGPLLPRVVPVLLGALRRPPAPAAAAAPDSFLLFDDVDDDASEGAEPMEEEEELVEVEVGGAYVQELEEACEALGEVAEHCGAAFLPYVEPSLEAVLELLEFPQAGVACLEPGAGEEEEDDDEEQAELAAELRELAGEGLVALAQAVGGQLAPHLDELLPHVLARLEPRCSVGERSWAAATLAGLGGALGGAVSRFLPRLGPALGAAARDPHPEVRGNGLYALGVVAAAAGPALGPYPSGTRPLREATPPPLGGVGQAPPPPPLPFAHPGGGCNEGPGGGGEEPQGRPRPLRVAPPPVTPQPSGHAHTPPWPRPQPVTPQPSGHTPPPPPACDVRILWPRPHSLATPPLPVMSQPLATPTHPGHAPPTCDIRAPWPRPPHRALTSQPSGHAHTPPGHAPPAPVTLEPSGHAHPPSGHSPFL